MYYFKIYKLSITTYLILCFQFFFITTKGQESLIESAIGRMPTNTLYCKPGVDGKSRGKGFMIRYGYQPGYSQTIRSSEYLNDVTNTDWFQAKIKVPLVNQPGLKLLLGYEYEIRRFRLSDNPSNPFSSITERIDGLGLKNNKFSGYLTKSFDSRNYLGLVARATFRGDYKGILKTNRGYRTYTFTAVWGIKPNKNLEWGLGIRYTNRFFRDSDQVLPFLVYNQTFNERWGIESTLPAQVYLRYNFTPSQLILMGFTIQSFAYGIDVLDPAELFFASAFRQLAINPGISFEKQLHSWIWLKVDGGASIPFRSEFLAINEEFDPFRQIVGISPYFNIGLFLAPPPSFIK